MLVENWGLGPTYALRTPDWEYIHNDTEELELYDMKADPWQLKSQHRWVDPVGARRVRAEAADAAGLPRGFLPRVAGRAAERAALAGARREGVSSSTATATLAGRPRKKGPLP